MKKRLYKDLRKIKINLFVNSFWTTQGFDKDKSFRQLVHIISPRTVSLQVSLLNSPLSEFLSDKCFHSHPIPLNILCHLAPRNVSDLPRPWQKQQITILYGIRSKTRTLIKGTLGEHQRKILLLFPYNVFPLTRNYPYTTIYNRGKQEGGWSYMVRIPKIMILNKPTKIDDMV